MYVWLVCVTLNFRLTFLTAFVCPPKKLNIAVLGWRNCEFFKAMQQTRLSFIIHGFLSEVKMNEPPCITALKRFHPKNGNLMKAEVKMREWQKKSNWNRWRNRAVFREHKTHARLPMTCKQDRAHTLASERACTHRQAMFGETPWWLRNLGQLCVTLFVSVQQKLNS